MANLIWKLYRYKLPFVQPVKMLGKTLAFREGMVLQIQDNQQTFGEGEIAPLEGVHQESLEQTEKTLLRVLEGKEEHNVEFPSIRFGLEMAWNIYLSKIQHQNPTSKINSFLPINALMTSDVENIEAFVQQQRKLGYKAIKMKIGVKPIQEEINRVLNLTHHLDDQLTLRLDANRAWTMDEALTFAQAIDHVSIEYCEEPLKKINQLKSFSEKTAMPIALDETVYETESPEFLPSAKIKALVLKPSRLGGWKSCKKWVNWALENKLQVTFSSCLESGLGLNWVAFMNASMLAKPTPAGLDTFKMFQTDLINPAFQVTNGIHSLPNEWPQFLYHNVENIGSGKLNTDFFQDFEINPS